MRITILFFSLFFFSCGNSNEQLIVKENNPEVKQEESIYTYSMLVDAITTLTAVEQQKVISSERVFFSSQGGLRELVETTKGYFLKYHILGETFRENGIAVLINDGIVYYSITEKYASDWHFGETNTLPEIESTMNELYLLNEDGFIKIFENNSSKQIKDSRFKAMMEESKEILIKVEN